MPALVSQLLDLSRIDSLFYKLSTVLIFSVAAFLGFTIQCLHGTDKLRLENFIKYALPPHGWKSASSSIDILFYIGGKLFSAILSFGEIMMLILFSGYIISVLKLIFPVDSARQADSGGLVILAIAIFIAQDFAKFWAHYLNHKVPALWELHKVHHSATFLSPLTTARRHPLADKIDAFWWVLMVSLPVGLGGFLFNLNNPDILLLLANVTVISNILILDPLRHSHLPVSFGPLNQYLVSPHMHQLHHSVKFAHWDKNMGDKLFVWDRIFRNRVHTVSGR